MRKQLFIILALLLVFAAAAPVSAEEAADQTLEIRLRIGSGQMTVGGVETTVTAPYIVQGYAMVPLRVATKAIGAEFSLKNDKEITLTYLNHQVKLTRGSREAYYDGRKVTLPVPVAMQGGVTMIPVRALEGLGARLSYDKDTQEIAIEIASSGNSPIAHMGIDSDAGKTRIGDSHYQWSINYPTGLVQDYQSADGSYITFRDIKDEYFLGIYVEDAQEEMNAQQKRDRIIRDYLYGETVLDKATVTGPGGSYERISVKDEYGYYYEYRGFQDNGRFYVLVFGKKASSLADLRPFYSLLDSFRTSFDRDDASLKDLSKIVDGLKQFENKAYGLSLMLPMEWREDWSASYPVYFSENAALTLEVSSLEDGDSLEAWIARQIAQFEKTYAEDYRGPIEQSDTVWSGLPARMVKTAFTYDKKNWQQVYTIYAVRDQYRYKTQLTFLGDEDAENDAWASIQETMKVDFEHIGKTFGNIPDDSDIWDLTETRTIVNQKLGYTLTVPVHWRKWPSEYAQGELFEFTGGSLSIIVFEDEEEPEALLEEIREKSGELTAAQRGIKVLEDAAVTFAGVQAHKLVVEGVTDYTDVPQREILYSVAKGDKAYLIHGRYYLANATDFVIGQLNDALNSFAIHER
jgi:hypothetical protein